MMMWRHIPAKSNTTFTSRKTSRDNKFQCRNDPLCREGIYLAFINKFRTNDRIDQTQYVLYYVTASFIRANEMYCLDCRYVERPLYQYCEMDTDSAYIALAGESIDDLVTSEHREHYFKHRSEWLPAECCDEHKEEYVNTRLAERTWTATEPCCLARKAFDKRTPGLFKIEWCGDGFIGLCSKTYYCFGSTDKCTTKGLNKRQNTIDKDAFLSVLTNRRSGGGVNRGFRVHNSSMMTYIQERAALTYFYPKRKVLEDGLTTAPLDL